MQLIERDRVLVMGAPGSGKSQSIVDLSLALPDVPFYVFDAQDSIMPLLVARQRRGESLPENMTLHRIGGDVVEAWDFFNETVQETLEQAKAGDWICFDVAADFWQLVQDAYIEKTYGVTTADFKGQKVEEAVKSRDGKKKKVLGFGGLDNDDWSVITPKYYATIPRALSTRCDANVWITANEKTPAHFKRGEELVFIEANLPGVFKKELVKPHAQSQLASQVSVILWLKHPSERRWTVSTIGKNRDGFVLEDVDCTDTSVWNVFKMEQGLDPERSPGKFYEAKARKRGKK